ncbi:hypothetical protein [Schlesneria paludicola]|uniref:hypothetical protein n=1 Tax=Schlesneria paludicola TaxID=360056 RepID=UPI00029A0DCA|nr:hypothetical protein [Schlesneria paludicola]
MDSSHRGVSARTVAELALVISKAARTHLNHSHKPSAASLKLFWQSSRSLEKRWATALDEWTVAGSRDLAILEQLAMRLLTSEMVVRIWGTILGSIDRIGQDDDLIRVAQSAVGCFTRSRNSLLTLLVAVPERDQQHAQRIDRLRRRCERWTDLLLGPIAVKSGCFEFAFSPERALDFGEELLASDVATGPNPAEHLVLASMQLTFGPHLSADGDNDDVELVSLIQSVISHLPTAAFQRNGSLRSLLEQRLILGAKRSERQPERDVGPDSIVPLFPHS